MVARELLERSRITGLVCLPISEATLFVHGRRDLEMQLACLTFSLSGAS